MISSVRDLHRSEFCGTNLHYPRLLKSHAFQITQMFCNAICFQRDKIVETGHSQLNEHE